MSKHLLRHAIAALTAAGLLLATAACGSTAKTQTETLSKEPAAGTPTSYTGKLPMPEQGKQYNNPQDIEDLKKGGEVTLPVGELGPNFNLLTGAGYTAGTQALWLMYMPHLWDYTADGQVKANPDFLDNVKQTSDDPETIVYDINEKATWNDGTPIDWTAFEATWKAMRGDNPDYAASWSSGYNKIASVERGDSDKQVVVTFKQSFYPYQAVFTQLINPKHATPEEFSKGWANNPRSEWASGPYQVESYSNSELVFTPNPKWWGTKPVLDRVTFRLMESGTSINAFKNGEVDATSVATADSMKIARGIKDTTIRTNYGMSIYCFMLNVTSKPLDDVKVRKAIYQAIDRKQVATIMFQGLDWSEPLPGSDVLLPFQHGYEDNLPKDSAFNTDNAKKTLESDGYKMVSDGYY